MPRSKHHTLSVTSVNGDTNRFKTRCTYTRIMFVLLKLVLVVTLEQTGRDGEQRETFDEFSLERDFAIDAFEEAQHVPESVRQSVHRLQLEHQTPPVCRDRSSLRICEEPVEHLVRQFFYVRRGSKSCFYGHGQWCIQ